MRIIAGEFGGRLLVAPPTKETRPITDRAKQSLFDYLTGWLEDARVLDAFAGTGSMGLECLSRGARQVIFVERGGACEGLRKNIEALGVQDRSVVLPIDAYRITRHPALIGEGAEPIDLAFIDPPYIHTAPGPYRARLVRLLAELAAGVLAPQRVVILRHPAGTDIAPLVPEGMAVSRVLTYGSMGITWLE